MKIAVLGDIHVNVDALRAAYDAALAHGVGKVYHIGDLGGYAPFVNEVVEFIIERDIEGVQGNYDYTVGNDSEHCGCKYEDEAQAAIAERGFAWTKEHTSERSKAFMAALPLSINFPCSGWSVELFHAAPHKNNLYWYEDRPDKFFIEMAGKTRADVLIYGHTHKPYRKDIWGKVFINAGSVGKPKDGDPRACVTLVTISAKGVAHEFLRVPYDVEKVAAAIVASGLPAEFAWKLKEAR